MLNRLRLPIFILPLLFCGYIFPAPFFVTNSADSGGGSLRQAILDSNAAITDPRNTITFDAGFTILLDSNLPAITHPVIINNTPIVAVTVNGQNIADIGLQINAGGGSATLGQGTIIQGITLRNFRGDAGGSDAYGIFINGSGNNQLIGNSISTIIGRDGNLTSYATNAYGIFADGNNNVIINTPILTTITGGSDTSNFQEIGGDAVGIFSRGNNNIISANASITIITGGTTGPMGDSGNALGMFLVTTTNTIIQSNKISAVTRGLGGNPGIATGIWIQNNSQNNLIGGLNDDASLGNTISGLTQVGARGIVVADVTSFNNTIESNSIFDIDGKGIDLQGAGNDNQVAPEITNIVRCSGGALAISGSLAATVMGTPYRIQFFNNGAASMPNKGKMLIGSITFVGNNGVFLFSDNFTPLVPVAANDWISATASVETPPADPALGNTSEFSIEKQVTDNPALSVSATALPQVGCDPINSQLTATPAGGTGPYTYLWTPDTDLNDPTSATPMAMPTQTTLYTVTVTDDIGCTASDSITITVNQTPVITDQPDNQVVCLGATVTFTAAASGIPTPTVQWQVSTNGGMTFDGVPGATNTTYSFTPVLSDSGNQYLAVFTNSCGVVPTNAATLTVNPLPTISTSANPTVITLGQSSTLTATLGSGTPPYFVTFSDGFISPVSANTSVTHEVSPTTTTTYSAVVTDSVGCESDPSNTITLTVLNPTPPPSDLKVVICGPKCRVTKSRKPRISGRTTPGAVVSLYANNSLVAKTKANNKGVFVVKPCCMLKRGCNTLVAQAVNSAGSTARSQCIKINVKC